MKLTSNLAFRKLRGHYFPKLNKIYWQIKGCKMNVRRVFLDDKVAEMIEKTSDGRGVENMFKSRRYAEQIQKETVIHAEEWENFKSPLKLDTVFTDKKLHENRDEVAFLFKQEKRFEFGENQAALLTNTIVRHEEMLPGLADTRVTLPEDHQEQLEKMILKAHVWTTDEDKLPRRYKPGSNIFKHKAEFGILPRNIVKYLLSDLLRYAMSSNHAQFPHLAMERVLQRPHNLSTNFAWRLPVENGGGDIDINKSDEESGDFAAPNNSAKQVQILYRGQSPIALFGVRPLPAFFSLSQSTPPLNHEQLLREMEPISPLIDLVRVRRYQLDEDEASPPSAPPQTTHFPHPHVISLSYDLPSFWSDFLEPEARPLRQTEKIAAALMHCHSYAIKTARRVFPAEAASGVTLPHPISFFCVMCDGVYFDLIAYQLNSTSSVAQPADSSPSLSPPANMAWLDQSNRIVDKIIPTYSRLARTRYYNAQPQLLRKLFQLYLYGQRDAML